MSDHRDGWWSSSSQAGKTVPKMVTARRASEYNMRHKNRGRALIFNHMHFDDKNPRKGTEVDCENLNRELARLGFQVTTYHDFSYLDIMGTIQEAAAQDHSDSDCILVAVLTHGEHGYLHARNCQYRVESIWSPFTADKCPTLAGKPKLFFIQACQGQQFDEGIRLQHTAQCYGTDGDSSSSYKISVHADFLIAYSTISGFFSWRNPEKGSWFIQSLCAELAENGEQLDLLTLLTFVCQRVAIEFESNTPDNPQSHGKKQVPCITSMLTRILRFESK